MFTQQNLGWSPIRRKCTTDLEFGNYTLFTKLTSGGKYLGGLPANPGMVTHQAKNGHPVLLCLAPFDSRALAGAWLRKINENAAIYKSIINM